MPFLLFSQELLKLNQLVVFPWLVVSARLALAWSKVAPDSRSSGKGAKSLIRGGATRIEGRGEHPASVVDRQELALK